MVIYIKGMEMPKNCHECPLLYVTSICDGFTDCPLIELHPQLNRLTSHGKEIPPLTEENQQYWINVYFKLMRYEDEAEGVTE